MISSRRGTATLTCVDACCPLCGWAPPEEPPPLALDAFFRTTDGFLAADIGYRVCPVDGLCFMSPRPTDESLSLFYAGAIEMPPECQIAANTRRHDWIVERVPLQRQAPVMLDVGCHDGQFLGLFGDDGWRMIGMEPSKTAADYLRHRRPAIELIEGFIPAGLAALAGRPVTLTTLNHVLEHLPEPLASLKALWEIGTEHLFIEVPNAAAGLDPRITREHGHLAYWTEATLTALVQRASFEPLAAASSEGDRPLPVIRLLARRTERPVVVSPACAGTSATAAALAGIARRWRRDGEDLPERLVQTLSVVPKGGKIGLFGAGSDAFRILRSWPRVWSAACFIDRNPLLLSQGVFLDLPLYTIEEALSRNLAAILITPRGSEAAIRAGIERLGGYPPLLSLADSDA